MDFSLSDEQSLLKDSVERFVAQRDGLARARASAAAADGYSTQDWANFADLGWLMLMIPEAQGGIGGGAIEASLVMEAFGRGLVAAPYLSTAVLAAGLLARADAPERQRELLDAIGAGEAVVALATEEASSRYHLSDIAVAARPDGAGWVLNGAKIAVQDGANADLFLVSARLAGAVSLLRVNRAAPGLSIRGYRTIDRRGACDLIFTNTPADLVMADAIEPLERATDEASLLMAAEALGCMEAAMTLTADYLKTRQQFGRTLSQFQVLTHRVADMFIRVENGRSMVLRGLSLIDAPAPERAAAVSATMVTVIQAGEFVCGQAIQLHGGIGMADESAIGHYYKRIRAIGRTYGDFEHHRRRHLALTQSSAA